MEDKMEYEENRGIKYRITKKARKFYQKYIEKEEGTPEEYALEACDLSTLSQYGYVILIDMLPRFATEKREDGIHPKFKRAAELHKEALRKNMSNYKVSFYDNVIRYSEKNYRKQFK